MIVRGFLVGHRGCSDFDYFLDNSMDVCQQQFFGPIFGNSWVGILD
jgi:hypothetical protein